jgi:hypothetical protein
MSDGAAASDEEQTRTLLTVIYDNGVEERLMELVEARDVEGWTRLAGAHGFGGAGYRLDTPVWPGVNNVLLLALPPEKARELAAALRTLQGAYRRKPGITIWMQTVTLL